QRSMPPGAYRSVSSWQPPTPVIGERVPRDLPEVAVWVVKETGVPAPEAVVRRISDDRACPLGLPHDCIDHLLRIDDVAERHRAEPFWRCGDLGVLGQRNRWIECEDEVVVVVEKHTHAVLAS